MVSMFHQDLLNSISGKLFSETISKEIVLETHPVLSSQEFFSSLNSLEQIFSTYGEKIQDSKTQTLYGIVDLIMSSNKTFGKSNTRKFLEQYEKMFRFTEQYEIPNHIEMGSIQNKFLRKAIKINENDKNSQKYVSKNPVINNPLWYFVTGRKTRLIMIDEAISFFKGRLKSNNEELKTYQNQRQAIRNQAKFDGYSDDVIDFCIMPIDSNVGIFETMSIASNAQNKIDFYKKVLRENKLNPYF